MRSARNYRQFFYYFHFIFCRFHIIRFHKNKLIDSKLTLKRSQYFLFSLLVEITICLQTLRWIHMKKRRNASPSCVERKTVCDVGGWIYKFCPIFHGKCRFFECRMNTHIFSIFNDMKSKRPTRDNWWLSIQKKSVQIVRVQSRRNNVAHVKNSIRCQWLGAATTLKRMI